MGSKPIFLIGAKGHASALLSVLYRHGGYTVVGLIDSFQPVGLLIRGLPILGGEEDLPRLCEQHAVRHLLVAIGDNVQRRKITERLRQKLPNGEFPSLVDPSAVVSADAQLSPGVVVMAQAHVGAGCVLEEGSLLNTHASLDHDGYLGAFASLAPGVITGGYVRIGAGTFIGLGTNLINGVQVGSHSVVGAGSLVLSDLPNGVVAYGAPAKVVRTRKHDEPYF